MLTGFKKYLVTLPPLAKVVVEVFFQGAAESELWKSIPWTWVNVVCLTLAASFLVQDLLSPVSRLKRVLRDTQSPAKGVSFVVNERIDPLRSCLVAIIEFKRPPDQSTVTVDVALLNQKSPLRRVIRTSVGVVDENEGCKITLGAIMLPHPGWTPRQSVWGMEVGPEGNTDRVPILENSRYLVSLRIDGHQYHAVVHRGSGMAHTNTDGFVIFNEGDAFAMLGTAND